MDDAQLQTVWLQRQKPERCSHLSAPLTMLMKQNLAKRVQRLGRLASIWDQVVPEELNRHTSIESFNRGVLTVMVDSAPHRFQLNTMLQAGLLRQIQSLFKTGAINKVRLIPGQFYSIDVSGTPRYTV